MLLNFIIACYIFPHSPFQIYSLYPTLLNSIGADFYGLHQQVSLFLDFQLVSVDVRHWQIVWKENDIRLFVPKFPPCQSGGPLSTAIFFHFWKLLSCVASRHAAPSLVGFLKSCSHLCKTVPLLSSPQLLSLCHLFPVRTQTDTLQISKNLFGL